MELKITRIGNSLGVILPRELLLRLRVDKGDSLFVSETPEGLAISPYDPAFASQMKAARDLMKTRRNALRELGRPDAPAAAESA
jgi:putative addiction module antidote